MRIFFAIPLTDPTAHAVVEFMEILKSHFSELKIHWHNLEKLHITLRFLGSVPDLLIPEIIQATTPVFLQQQPFQLTFQNCSLFPSAHHPHALVLFLQASQALTQLVDALTAPLLALGLKCEQRKYIAHLTLGKIHGKVLPALSDMPLPKIPILQVNQCQLLQSTPHEQTTAYSLLHPFYF